MVRRENQLFVTDYTNADPDGDLTKQYKLLVPKVDANGNETSGIRIPEVAAPRPPTPAGTCAAAGVPRRRTAPSSDRRSRLQRIQRPRPAATRAQPSRRCTRAARTT